VTTVREKKKTAKPKLFLRLPKRASLAENHEVTEPALLRQSLRKGNTTA
jgi:hypothetical protein